MQRALRGRVREPERVTRGLTGANRRADPDGESPSVSRKCIRSERCTSGQRVK